MKRILLILALLGLSVPAFARQRIFGYCEQGGKTVTTSGLTSTTNVQGSYPSCTVTVWAAGTVTPLTLYADNLGTPKGNPFTADTNGYWFAYIDNGRADVRLSGGGIPAPFTLGDYMADDNAEQTFPLNPLAFSATPTFDASLFSSFSMTLTGNVTSSTVTNSKTGRVIAFLLCQDGTGGRTFAWPGTFASTPTLDARASKCSNTVWFYNGTNWKLLGSGGDSLSTAASSVIMNGAAVLTLPTTSDTLMGRATPDTMLNKIMSGGTLSGSITNAGTITGGTLSGYTMAGAITGTGSTTTGGTFSGITLANPTMTGTVGGTPTFSSPITISLATGTAPLNITSTTPVPNLTVMRINSSLTVNTANAVTFTFAPPAAPRTITLNDFGRDSFVLLTGTAGQIDCDTSDTLCNWNEYRTINLGQCTSPTTATPSVSLVSPDPPIPVCVNGANLGYFTLWMPGAITQMQTNVGTTGVGAATTLTTTYTTAAGRLLVTVVGIDGNTTVSGCTDGTNVYSLAIRQNNAGNNTVETWYKANSSAVTSATLTCTLSASNRASLVWADFNGVLTVAPLDVTAGTIGNDTAPTSPNTSAPAAAPSLAIGAVVAVGVKAITSPSSGFVQNPSMTGSVSPTVAMQTKVPPSATVQGSAFALNLSAQWASTMAVFKAATTGVTYTRATYALRVPDDFVSGTLDVKFGFRTAQPSLSNAGILLGVATTCVADGAALDQALNAESTVSNTALAQVSGGANTTAVTSIDITGCSAGSHMFVSLFRKRGISGDQTALPAELTSFQYKIRHSQ